LAIYYSFLVKSLSWFSLDMDDVKPDADDDVKPDADDAKPDVKP
jgi:hypothetical protein